MMISRKRIVLNTFLCIFVAITFSVTAQRVTARTRTADEEIATLSPLVDVITEMLSYHVVGSDQIDINELTQEGIVGMVSVLDQHSQYMPKEYYKEFKDGTSGSFGGLGIRIQTMNGWLAVVEPLPGTPAARAHLRAEDRIVRINGRTTKGMPISDAVARLKGTPGSTVTISVLRKNWDKPRDYTMERAIIQVPSVEGKWIARDSIGYVRLREFQSNSGRDMARMIQQLNQRGMKGFVLDLRFNQGGLLNVAREVSDMLLPKDVVVVKIKEGNKTEMEALRSQNPPLVTCPMAVLVNYNSASASEIVAGAVQDWRRGVIIAPEGERTYGKGSVQTVIDLTDGSGLKLTTAKYFTPTERSIHRTDPKDPKSGGIEPDVTVDLDSKTRRSLYLFKMGELPKEYAAEVVIDPQGPEPIPPEDLPEKNNGDSAPGVWDFDLERAVQILKAAPVFTEQSPPATTVAQP